MSLETVTPRRFYGIDETGDTAQGQRRTMRARGVDIFAAAALLALAACGDSSRGATKTEQSSAEHIAAALNICDQPAGTFAHGICANRALSTIDAQMRQNLTSQAANISDAGAQLLVENQARWREAQRIGCGVADQRALFTTAQQQCLEGEFRARAQDVRTAVQQIGGYTFQRMELIDAVALTPDQVQTTGLGANAPAAAIRDIEFPRIDGRQTPSIRRFNDLAAQEPQSRLGDGTSETVTYEIGYAGPELISVRFASTQDALTQGATSSTLRAVNVVMADGHELNETDVFAPNSGWQDFITNRAVAEIAKQYPDYSNFPPRRDVADTATKPHLWLIKEHELVLMFPTLSYGGSQSDPPVYVSIPWTDLRPYLNPAAPLPIRPAA
jgi:hypothetical protein